MAARLSAELLAQILELDANAAFAFLRTIPLTNDEIVEALADAAVARTIADPDGAAALLRIADLAAAGGISPAAEAALRYAQARSAVVAGGLDSAESLLRTAQSLWSANGSTTGAARSGLGLTQVLAMQGRFDDAEAVINSSIALLEAAVELDEQLLHLDAQQNRATLRSYQERFEESLTDLDTIRNRLLALLNGADGDTAADLQQRLGLVERDLALAYTYVDQPGEAEQLLLSAINRLAASELDVDRGQTRTNLGHLYQRTGRYAEALQQLDTATVELLGTVDVDSAEERWPIADVLFLEQGAVYLALNLLPEAETALRRAIRLFRITGQRYELGQALYLFGLLNYRLGDEQAAAAALAEAAEVYAALDNAYWLNRIRIAQAGLAVRNNDLDAADALLRPLLADSAAPGGLALAWDQALRVELHLVQAQTALLRRNLAEARRSVATAQQLLNLPALDATVVVLPHLQLRLLHTAGLIERADGNLERARRLFTAAIEVAENQRALLPIEELRSAFLVDKADLYADLTLSLLDLPQADDATVAEAFAVVERARSRALLERLLATVEAVEEDDTRLTPEMRAQIAETRRRLFWLYNQLLGGEGGSRGGAPALTAEIRAREAALQQLEWRRHDWLAQAEPVGLPELQSALTDDQIALAYFVAGEEVMVFLITCDHVRVVRELCRLSDLEAAQYELRFQLGRVEIGSDYLERHRQRLISAAKTALKRLYDLVLLPVRGLLDRERLVVIPFGSLHVVPFHALWDGSSYMLFDYEVTYAASASIAVHRRRSVAAANLNSLAGLALNDAAIPQAEAEVRTAARYFRDVRLFLDNDAGLDGLKQAARSSDVLHIATHGVFRPDNPFFSSLKLADGWIDVRAIYRLPLRARLVVLSACESGAVQVQSSDEAVGLVRGFLGAGAESLVVSFWNVHDATAAQMMNGFYANLTANTAASTAASTAAAQSGRPAAALRAVQSELAGQDQHPYFWAPYAAIGD